MSLQRLKARAFENPEVKAEYDQLASEFALANTLISMRQKAGLTQDKIAKRMGTQKSNISRLERSSSNPSWKTLLYYAHACGFELSVNVQNIN